MSYETKFNDQGTFQVFELSLTTAQYRALSQLLPHGYSLELLPKLKKEPSNRPTKKLFTNEGIAVKKNGHGQGEPTPTSEHSDSKGQSTNRILRDHKKKTQTYLEEKYGEVVAVPTTSSKSAKPMNDGIKKCLNLVQKLKKHNCSAPFLLPVDVEGLGLYDYYDVVQEPMDLSTVEKKLKNGEYSSVHEFGTDIRKIWNNAFNYNTEASSIYQMTTKMSSYFERLFKEVEDVQFNDKIMDLEKKLKELSKQVAELNQPAPMSGTKVNRSGTKSSKSPAVLEEPMSIQEKKILCENIKRLPPDSLRGVWEIVSKGLPNNQHNKEELVFDIDALPVKVTRELERYVKNKMGQNKQNKKKEPPAPKVAHQTEYYDPNPQYYNHTLRPDLNGAKYQGNAQTVMQQQMTTKNFMDMNKKDRDELDSRSSDSSFISDSESGSDDERKHKSKPVT
jgi:hypothetical protein